jgi:subtilase family serine protease
MPPEGITGFGPAWILGAIVVAVVFFTDLSLGLASSFADENVPIAQNSRVILHGNVSPKARQEFDQGPTAPSLPIKSMILLLRIPPEKQQALDRLLAEQQEPSSPNFHRWLTPDEFGKRFGLTREEIAKVEKWLLSQGFTIDKIAGAGTWINFSGTAAEVEQTFHVKMRDYLVDGRLYHANSNDPSIPSALAGLVVGPVKLNDFPLKPMPRLQGRNDTINPQD